MREDSFYDALIGRPGADEPEDAGHRVGRRLRDLIRNVDMQEAAQLAVEAKQGLDPEDRALAERVWTRLVSAGHVQALSPISAREPAHDVDSTATQTSKPRAFRMMDWMGEALLGSAWQRGVAVAAFLAVAGLLLFRIDDGQVLLPEDTRERSAARAGDELVLDSRPADRQANLKAAFESLGASVVTVQTTPTPEVWLLHVKLSDASALPAANRIRAEAGLSPTVATEFTIMVKQTPVP